MNNAETANPTPEPIAFPHKIFVNQAGYLPDDEKYAIITTPAPYFSVIDTKGRTCYSGQAEEFGHDDASDDDVFRADFSQLKTPGRYFIKAGREQSLEFVISGSVFNDCFDNCVKAYYYLRCGCGLEPQYAGVWHHKVCHSAPAALWENKSVPLEVSGGWHDAGDYGRYVTPAATTLAHLFYAWKLFPSVFSAQNIDIPGKQPPMPDVLTECRYELEWLLKMQRFDGAVWHKATTIMHAPFVMPEDDKEQIYVMPVSSSATADFAAITALASTIYQRYDSDFADRLIKSSAGAWRWLEKNPVFIGFNNPEGCNTGVYGEEKDTDNRFWAAAELYGATGSEMYYQVAADMMSKTPLLTALGCGSVGGFGALSLILGGTPGASAKIKLQTEFINRAEALAGLSGACGWRVSLSPDQYYWGSNMTVMKNGMIFLIADYIEKQAGLSSKPRFRKYALAQLNYILGINATGYSYITGTGDFCVNYPHLRTAYADGIEECIPGFVTGGPNHQTNDPTAAKLIPKGTPPMKCFLDDFSCFSLNEVAIYWNSPTVFVLAGIIDGTDKK